MAKAQDVLRLPAGRHQGVFPFTLGITPQALAHWVKVDKVASEHLKQISSPIPPELGGFTPSRNVPDPVGTRLRCVGSAGQSVPCNATRSVATFNGGATADLRSRGGSILRLAAGRHGFGNRWMPRKSRWTPAPPYSGASAVGPADAILTCLQVPGSANRLLTGTSFEQTRSWR